MEYLYDHEKPEQVLAWIPVADHYPEIRQEVLIKLDMSMEPTYAFASYRGQGVFLMMFPVEGDACPIWAKTFNNVIAWMPIPEYIEEAT